MRHQLALLPLTIALMFAISLQSPRMIRRLAVIGLDIGILALAATLVIGVETEGARRWLGIAGLTLQPSEFVKPCFAIVCAWLFAQQKNPQLKLPGNLIALGLYVVIVALLAKQPDIGQAAVITAIRFAEFFLAGLSLLWVGMAAASVVGLGVRRLFRAAAFSHPRRRLPQPIGRRRRKPRLQNGFKDSAKLH